MIKSEQGCPGYPRKLLFYDVQSILMEQSTDEKWDYLHI